MSLNPVGSFDNSLAKFRSTLTENQKEEFKFSSIEDVKHAIQQIQDRIGPEKRLRNFTRIKKFLEGMKQVEELVKVFINASEVVAFIWGPIKLTLLIATTKIEALERLLDTYEEIGEVIHGLRQYDSLFRNYSDVKIVLERYFYDVLQFHQCVLRTFTGPRWKMFFAYAWPTFKTQVQPILDSLKRHRALLADEKLTAAIVETQESRTVVEQRFDGLSKLIRDGLHNLQDAMYTQNIKMQKSLEDQKNDIKAKLRSPDFEADHRWISAQRHSPSSGNWLLNKSVFTQWMQPRTPSDSVLYLHGMPGSGKTTLVSRIIDHVRSQNASIRGAIAFFYFKHQDDTRRSVAAMLRALMVQFLYQDDTAFEFIRQECFSLNHSELDDIATLQEQVRKCLLTQREAWVVLDGIDECGNDPDMDLEPGKALLDIIRWFHASLIPEAWSEGSRVRLLLAGQRDGYFDSHLSPHPNICVDTTIAHIHDIRAYSAARVAEIAQRFTLNKADEFRIVERVTEASKGMFLYVKVVLHNLLAQGSLKEFEDELTQANFPEGLNAAYDRVAVRVLDRGPFPKRDAAIKILGWMTCAARPLRWREIQSRFCIDVDRELCDSKNMRVDGCKVICGSFVEMEPCPLYTESPPEQVVNFIHETAAKYLLHTGRVCLLTEHRKMANFCMKYLVSHPFGDELEEARIQELALSGYYGFHDYALAFWHRHVDAIAVTETEEISSTEVLQSAVQRMFHKHADSSKTGANDRIAQPTPTQESLQMLMETWYHKGSDAFKGFENQAISVREAIESINLTELCATENSRLLDLLGRPRFKCSKVRCLKFADGFLTRKDRDSHLSEHERPFKCPVESCHARVSGFSSQPLLDSHAERFHNDEISPSTQFAHLNVSIFTACSQGRIAELKALHRRGTSLDEPKNPKSFLTPLILAVRHGHAAVCQYLVAHGADLYRFRHTDVSPLGEAVKRHDVDLFHSLCSAAGKNAKCSLEDFTSHVSLILQRGSLEMMDGLLSWQPQFELKSIVGTVLGAEFHHLRTSWPWKKATHFHRFFSKAFPELYKGSGSGLKLVHFTELEKKKHEEWYSILMSRTALGDTILHRACQEGHYGLVESLLDLLPNDFLVRGTMDRTPLHVIAISGYRRSNVDGLDTARRILNWENDLAANARDLYGNIPLHLAVSGSCFSSCREILQLLIDSTPNLDSENNIGKTPLQEAITRGSEDAVERLLATNRVDVTKTDREGLTLLSVAAKESNPSIKIMKFLLQAHPPLLHLTDNTSDKLTPLHHARWQRDKVRYLLSLPEADKLVHAFLASPVGDIRERARRLLELAREYDFEDAVRIIQESGMVDQCRDTPEA